MIADGFYEWQKTNGKKQPYFIGMKDETPFAFAGLWESWKDPANGPVESCALIITDANELVRPIHDRMPVILPRNDYAKWLDPEVEDAGKLQELLVPFPAEEMKTYPVSTLVNKPQNNGPECLAPVKIECAPAPPKDLF
jgi:putative SOS response-associated peptidase YedK